MWCFWHYFTKSICKFGFVNVYLCCIISENSWIIQFRNIRYVGLLTHHSFIPLSAFSLLNTKYTNNTYPFGAITSYLKRLMTRGAKRDRVRWSSASLVFKFMYIYVNNLVKRLRFFYGACKNMACTQRILQHS